jgi:GTP pyrophosphokinase
MDNLIEDRISLFLLDEKDDFGQRLTDHSIEVLRHLRALHLGDACELAAQLASAENNIAVKRRVLEAQSQLGAEVCTLFNHISRVREMANKTRDFSGKQAPKNSLEALRRLLVSLSSDLRVIIVLLTSRLETLRFHAREKKSAPENFARETLDVFAPLANRLGMWNLKWELEDLAFRYAYPSEYKTIASLLAVKRAERESTIEITLGQVNHLLDEAGVRALVSGRPKHIYSIYKKMQAKQLSLLQIQDLLALRIVVEDEEQCYRVLGAIHSQWLSKDGEFDDYIAKPKVNGYKSLHTVIELGPNRPLEIQIRTRAMHEFAEFGAAAHWRYKEASTGTGQLDPQHIAARKLSWVRQLLAWQQELGKTLSGDFAVTDANQPILVLTPEAKIIELPAGATAIDFAYHVHTDLGHRCRGARVDGALVSLSRALKTGQVVEIIVAKRNEVVGPSRDWLNPELGFVVSHRARTKVRVWFNDMALRAVESTPSKLPNLTLPAQPTASIDRQVLQGTLRQPASGAKAGQVLVVGVDLLLTQLARCCRPIPPDAIQGYVTTGKGISIHRRGCANLISLSARRPERVLETTWDGRDASRLHRQSGSVASDRFNADIQIECDEIPTLLRDVTEVFSRENTHVSALIMAAGLGQIKATLGVEDQSHLNRTLRALAGVKGVLAARRR